MQVIRSLAELRAAINSSTDTVGFVPTMGALHQGHVSLVDIARTHAKRVVVSIFVNPTQFAPHEDFAAYPRQEASDLALLKAHNVDIVYLPDAKTMYPKPFHTGITTGPMAKELEGVARPHFFDGVALVVSKLFLQVQPDIAVFGEKDFQQLFIIRQLVRELDMPIEIIPGPIVREASGLAMSSRNAYLSERALREAPALYRTLCSIQTKLQSGDDIATTLNWGKEHLLSEGFKKVDYLELRHSLSLAPVTTLSDNCRLLAAAYLEGVRLLDNIAV